MLCDALQNAEPISLELDRNLQVLLPSQAAKRVELPPVLFSITAEELKREQQMRFVERFLGPLNKVLIVPVCDHLCDLVVRVSGNRSRGPGSIPSATRFCEK
jgi:hypothetical protein